MAFDAIEPFGEEREDFRAGLVCSVVANTFGGPKDKQGTAWQPQDFMPLIEGAKAKAMHPQSQSPEEMLAVAERVTAMFGGRDLRVKK